MPSRKGIAVSGIHKGQNLDFSFLYRRVWDAGLGIKIFPCKTPQIVYKGHEQETCIIWINLRFSGCSRFLRCSFATLWNVVATGMCSVSPSAVSSRRFMGSYKAHGLLGSSKPSGPWWPSGDGGWRSGRKRPRVQREKDRGPGKNDKAIIALQSPVEPTPRGFSCARESRMSVVASILNL